MRKKGKPNPEQKYFLLVVALEAVYLQNNSPQEIPLCALATEKIIVRASNPGLFEPEQEISWSKNPHNDTVYHLGKVGVGTDASKEMLTVQGNIQVGETIMLESFYAKEIYQLFEKVILRLISHLKIACPRYSDKVFNPIYL